MVQRRGAYYLDYHEIRNEFTIFYYKSYELLSKDNIELIIFSNLPHEGVDFIYYNVARILNIKTLIFYQSIFPNKTFVTTKLDDFSEFKNIPEIFSNNINIEFGFTQNLCYMKEVNEKKNAIKKGILHNILFRCKNNINFLNKKLLNAINYKTNQPIIKNILLKIIKYIENSFFHLTIKKYELSNSVIDKLKKEKKCIYIPLHLQPELTTATLGGFYEDQLSMIEKVSLEVKDHKEYIIIVKENPKQTSYQRKNFFFQRLNNLDNVYLANSLYLSEDLIKSSSLVVSITGTVGWEAIKGGRKCFIFGQAWYKRLPGCYLHDEYTLLECLLDESIINFNTLQEAHSKLMSKCINCIVDSYYIKSFPDFSYATNSKNLVNAISKLISSNDVKW